MMREGKAGCVRGIRNMMNGNKEKLRNLGHREQNERSENGE